MLLVEVLALNKCLLGVMKYIYKMKSLKDHNKRKIQTANYH